MLLKPEAQMSTEVRNINAFNKQCLLPFACHSLINKSYL